MSYSQILGLYNSTEACILYLTYRIMKAVLWHICGMVVLDLQKAFDTVDLHFIV